MDRNFQCRATDVWDDAVSYERNELRQAEWQLNLATSESDRAAKATIVANYKRIIDLIWIEYHQRRAIEIAEQITPIDEDSYETVEYHNEAAAEIAAKLGIPVPPLDD
jgi:hypothetical protein